MKAAILSIGDELLIGQTINTNAAWLGKELTQLGIAIDVSWTIQDTAEAIHTSLDQLIPKVDLIVCTGGLGPTKDDLTKHALCEYFGTTLEINKEILTRIEDFFKRRKREMLEVNIQQAALPVDCTILHNYHGTASGMWFEKDGCIVISLPGVPYEMKGIMNDEVLPRLRDIFPVQEIYFDTLMTQGIGESFLAEKIEDWENKVRGLGYKLAYLPSPGIVRLRLSSEKGASEKERIQELLKEVQERLPQHVYSLGEIPLAATLGELLMDRGLTIGTVESCSGGSISKELVRIPGSSRYYEGSLVVYSYAQKENVLGIPHEQLSEYGAVSKEVITQMAINGQKKLGTNICIATSGIAGPSGGTKDKPVGTVWVAVTDGEIVFAKQFFFGDNRERNIQVSTLTALNLARCFVLGILAEKKEATLV
jgi:nicotinamide-nucleotide amidase